MRGNTKKVRKHFDYLECDKFTAYLEKMAAQGWHFREWGGRLVFERREPEQATYCVEVFDKADEDDERPNPDTLEFAEYCEAAGWKLMASKRKFCIFKKCKEDAADILTPQERVDYAAAAQRSIAVKAALGTLFIVAMYVVCLVIGTVMFDYGTLMFDHSVLLNRDVVSRRTAIFWLIIMILEWIEIAGVVLWHRRQTKRIEEGVDRPARRNSRVSVGLLVLVGVIVLAITGGEEPSPPDYLHHTVEAVCREDGMLMLSEQDYEEGILGSTTECRFWLIKDGDMEKFSTDVALETLAYDCTLYESKCIWVMNRMWNNWTEKGMGRTEPLDLQGNTAQEGFGVDGKMLFRFEDAILVLEEISVTLQTSESELDG